MQDVEIIRGGQGEEIAYLVRSEYRPGATTFVTPPEHKQQVGFIVYPEGGEVARHRHKKLPRNLVGTSEVVVIKKGRCEIDLYGTDGAHIATRELAEGDLILILDGGHAMRMLEDTMLLEVKQGPYAGVDDKEHF